MSDEVTVPYGDNAGDTAVLLLAAAEELKLGAGAVRTSEGAFLVPKEVADTAGVDYEGKEPVKKAEPAKKAQAAKKSAKKK